MKVLNFGSLNIDHVYQVEHFVTPGETIGAGRLEHFCGGKGLNQSVALAKAGAEVYHAGKYGVDGAMLKEALEAGGVRTDYLAQTDGVNGHAVIQVNPSGQNCIIIYGGSNQTITEDYVDSTLAHFSAGDMVLMQNETNCTAYIARRCTEKGIRVAFNPSPISQSLLSDFPFPLVSLFFVNEVEGYELTHKKEPDGILDGMMEKYPASACVLTLGKRGVIYRDKDLTLSHGTYKVDVADTTAAGDTFTGFFIGCLAAGCDIATCLKKASVASSLAVSRKGASTSIPTMAEVDAALGRLPYLPF